MTKWRAMWGWSVALYPLLVYSFLYSILSSVRLAVHMASFHAGCRLQRRRIGWVPRLRLKVGEELACTLLFVYVQKV